MKAFTRITKNHHIVDKLRERLEELTLSDYHGLDSPGFTCYLNSVLQVLFMTSDFREAVIRCCIEDSTTIDGQLRKLFNDLEKRKTKTHDITERLGITNLYEQRDAAEYFERILCWINPEASKVFKGELNHKTTCHGCYKKNGSRSSFWILPLAVESDHQTFDVGQGLKDFFKKQIFHGDNQVYCSHCDKKQNAYIKPELTQNPDVLTLLLKRFTFDYHRQCYVKVHCKADVPQTLYMECTYELYAVVNHRGTLSGGHYTAHIKSFENGHWYYFNDDTVKNLSRQPFRTQEESLRSCTAYLLMYRKVRKELEQDDGRDQDAHSAHSDIEAERSQDTGKDKEAQLQIRGRIGGETLKKNLVDAACFVEPDGLQQNKTFPLMDNEADGDSFRTQTQKLHVSKTQFNGNYHVTNGQHLCTNSKHNKRHLSSEGTLAVNFRTQQENHNTKTKRPRMNGAFCKTQDATGTKTGVKINGGSVRETVHPELKGESLKLRKEAGVSDMSDSASRRSHSQSGMNRPTERIHSQDMIRRSSTLNRNKVKTQHDTQTVIKTERLSKKSEAKRCEDRSGRPPWR
ncbi:ubiquitin carboxyl-terminal hydrolase 47-like isoform X2 [Mugil cephalus]|uniref:ubiquitin carboxyl-terminal hydrolase 47-like isoform X2 n=1 Tax=Mugil cephalus TaxID=48193 RepID=UPI001FB65764|nr:ubiquitin carboxyl-terminal hydrolase 47-like isoform X2 [Mugil cephalus]